MSDDNVMSLQEKRLAKADALKSGGGNGTSGGMEDRIKALEGRADKVESKLDKLLSDVGEIKGKLSNMPGTWQIVAINASLLALALGAGFGTVTILRMLTPVP